MASDSVVSALQLAHVVFNTTLFLGFVSQGVLGWRIRSRRVAGVPQDFSVVKRHRARGPILASLLPVGFLVGLSTAFLHHGIWVRYPAHLAAGTALLALVAAAMLVSRRIRGAQSRWRTPHGALGLLLLCAYLVQIYLGLNIFL